MPNIFRSHLKMPSIYNWSKIDIISLCDTLGITCEFEGYGFVASQSIQKGELITPDSILKVSLKSEL